LFILATFLNNEIDNVEEENPTLSDQVSALTSTRLLEQIQPNETDLTTLTETSSNKNLSLSSTTTDFTNIPVRKPSVCLKNTFIYVNVL
jgi:hypothetical protein